MTQTVTTLKNKSGDFFATVEGQDVRISFNEYLRILAGFEVDLTGRVLEADPDYADWLASVNSGIPTF